MATTVQIELKVDEKGAISGIRSVGTALEGTTVNVNNLDTTLNKLNAHLDQLGQKAKPSFKKVEEGALNAHQKVHLLSEEIGIHIPRAMQGIISKSPAVMSVISGLGSAMIGLGAIQIGAMVFTQLYDGAKKLYEKWLDVDGAIKRYNEEAGIAAAKKFYEDAGIDQLNADLKTANQQLDLLNKKRADSPKANMGPGFAQFDTPGIYKVAHLFGVSTPEHYGVRDANNQNEKQGQSDADRLRLMDETHKRNLQNVEDERLVSEARVTGIAREREARASEYKAADEDRRYRLEHAQVLAEIANRGIDEQKLKPGDKGYRERVIIAPDVGNSENASSKSRADAELKSREIEISRSQTEEEIRLKNAAIDAALRGDALYRAQANQQIDELQRHHMASGAAVNAVWAKFHAEEIKRLREQEYAITKMRGETSLAGMTGEARVKQEGQNRINDVLTNPSSQLNPGERLAEINEIQKQTAQQIGALNKSFAERVDQVVGQSATRELTGFARIRADAEEQIRSLEKDQKEHGGTSTDLEKGKAGILAGAAGLESERARKISEETAQIEAEAHVHSLNAEKQKTAAIEAEYKARKDKYFEQMQATEIGEEDYNRRVKAAAEERDAEIAEASKAQREKMAGEFTSMFKSLDHPMKYLQELGDKFAGQAAASMMQRLQQHVEGTGAASADGGSGHKGGWKSLFGDMPKMLGGKKAPGQVGVDDAAHAHTAASANFSIGHAILQVGAISFAGGSRAGTGTGGGSFSSGGSSVSGGTGTLSAGSSGASGGFAESGTSERSTLLGGGNGSGSGVTNLGTPLPGTTAAGGLGGGVGSFSGAINTAQQGFAGYKQLKEDFKKSSADGSSSDSGSGGGKSAAVDKGVNAAEGAVGVYSAYKGGGGAGGAMKGAMSGMEAGMAIAGPMGAVIGLAAGAIIGGIGSGTAAREYDLKTVRPRISADMDAFHQGGMSYLDAYADVASLQMEAAQTTTKMGPADGRYYQNTIKPELKQAQGKLTAEQKAGRSQYSMSAAQHDTGGVIDSFGDLATSPDHGLIHAQLGEFTVKPNVYQRNKSTLDALNSGASMDAIHANYRNTMQSRDAQRGASGGDRTLNLHVHAIDSQDAARFFNKNMHIMRGALNNSIAENSGGGL